MEQDFYKLPRKERRRLVGEDILAFQGVRYTLLNDNTYIEVSGSMSAKSLKDILSQNSPGNCIVCMIGAVLCGVVSNNGDISLTELSGALRFSQNKNVREMLYSVLSDKELFQIETFFEGDMGSGSTRYADLSDNTEDVLQARAILERDSYRIANVVAQILIDGGKLNGKTILKYADMVTSKEK